MTVNATGKILKAEAVRAITVRRRIRRFVIVFHGAFTQQPARVAAVVASGSQRIRESGVPASVVPARGLTG